MQQYPRPGIWHQGLPMCTGKACGVAAVVLAIGVAFGQPPARASSPVHSNAKPPATELAENTGVPPSAVQLMQQDQVQILALAMQVDTEVSHNSRDLLLLDVVRKAEQIRRLANQLKHEIKLTSRRK